MSETTAVQPATLTPTQPSHHVAHVYVALNAVQGELARIGIPKDGVNKDQGFRFRSIDAVYATLSPLLVEHKLLMLPRGVESDQVERATKSGAAKFCTRVTFEFDFVSAIDGSKRTVRAYGEGMDMADKSTAKAQSQAYKYAALMAFCIPLTGEPDGDDDDGGDPAIAGTANRPAAPPPPATETEPAPRMKGALKAAMEGVEVPVDEQQKLRVVGKSLIDLVNQEASDMGTDNSYKILEQLEPLTQKHEELLWLTNYLSKHTKVKTRCREVLTAYYEDKRKRQALAAPAPAPGESLDAEVF